MFIWQLGLNPDKLKGIRVLACVCGLGLLSSTLAAIGCCVDAIDVSPNSLEMTAKAAALNELSNLVLAQVMFVERMTGFADNSFDYIVGIFVLHHVDIHLAGMDILRVLRPNCRAYFLDNSANNKLLMLIRGLLPENFGIHWRSDGIEHSFMQLEIKMLESVFRGKCHVKWHDIVFFTLLDEYIYHRRLLPVSLLLRGLDRIVYVFLPSCRTYSHPNSLLCISDVYVKI